MLEIIMSEMCAVNQASSNGSEIIYINVDEGTQLYYIMLK